MGFAHAQIWVTVAIGYRSIKMAAEASEPQPVTDPLVAELHTRVKEAFGIFDHERNGTIDVRCLSVLVG